MTAFEFPVPNFWILFLLGLTNTWPAAALRNGIAPLGGFLQRALQLQEPEGQQQQPKKETNKQNIDIITLSGASTIVTFSSMWNF